LVAIVAAVPPEDLRRLRGLRSRYGSVTIVHIDRSAWDASAPVGPALDTSALRVTRDAPFVASWSSYVRMASSGRPRIGAGG
jgi:hypothetical protein